MGESFERAAGLDATYHMATYARKPVMFVRGEGSRLYDDDGREYLDFVSGIGAVNLGHAHPAVTAAIAEQAGKLVHVSNLFHVEHRARLAEVVATLAGGGCKVFFANSGTESVEGAIKLARRWGKLNKGPGCYRIVTAEGGFHGRTMGSLTATAQASKQDAFAPLLPGFSHVPFNNMPALESVLDDSVCAVMLEVVQGEGGVHPCTEEYLIAVRRLCDVHGVLLILDEVQTGFFRTGPAFAHQAFGIKPDIMTLAKAMANGLPIGAVVATDEVAAAFEPGDHGSTFGGGPVVCAAALATIHALGAERLGERSIVAGAYLKQALLEFAEKTGEVSEVRGLGLMAAIQLTRPIAQAMAAKALDRGIVLNSIGDSVIRFLPTLVCNEAEIDTLLATLEALVEEA